jgi:hypothetical protein
VIQAPIAVGVAALATKVAQSPAVRRFAKQMLVRSAALIAERMVGGLQARGANIPKPIAEAIPLLASAAAAMANGQVSDYDVAHQTVEDVARPWGEALVSAEKAALARAQGDAYLAAQRNRQIFTPPPSVYARMDRAMRGPNGGLPTAPPDCYPPTAWTAQYPPPQPR